MAQAHAGQQSLDDAETVSQPSAPHEGPGADTHYDGVTLSAESSNRTEDEKHFVSSSVAPAKSSRFKLPSFKLPSLKRPTVKVSLPTRSQLNPKNWSRKMRIIGLATVISTIVVLVPAIAVPVALRHRQNVAAPLFVNPPMTTVLARNTPLRIMSLGASITYGFLSTDGNGYRNDLQALIEQGGNTNVTYVGSRNNGTMTSNAVEGWPGYRIDQVWPKASTSVPASKPNIILVNVGTNDCVQGFDMDNTTQVSPLAPSMTVNPRYTIGDRMRILVEDLFVWSPNVTVVMSTLILNKVAETNRLVNDANSKFAAVAANFQAQGRRLILANMSATAGGPNITTMADATHPNDIGYSMMANRWYLALKEASDRGMIVAPS